LLAKTTKSVEVDSSQFVFGCYSDSYLPFCQVLE